LQGLLRAHEHKRFTSAAPFGTCLGALLIQLLRGHNRVDVAMVCLLGLCARFALSGACHKEQRDG
jgi:hypothetical protein